MKIDTRLEGLKNYPRAMKSYIFTLYEFVLEYKPQKMLELGTQNGISTKTILLAMKENNLGELVTVDQKDRSTILDAEFSDVKDRCSFIRGNTHSQETIDMVKNHLGEGELFDMSFIDAGHSFEDITLDWQNYYPLIRSGGVLMLHDTVNSDAGVRDFWPSIQDEKFNITWGDSRRRGLIPGFGIVRKLL